VCKGLYRRNETFWKISEIAQSYNAFGSENFEIHHLSLTLLYVYFGSREHLKYKDRWFRHISKGIEFSWHVV